MLSGKKNKVLNVSEPVLKAMDYIYYHLHMPMTIASVASSTGYSPNYLNSLFRKEKGTTISEYIRTQKIETAKRLLIHSDHNVSQIGAILAFSSESHFIRVFREQTGLTPKQFKSKNYRHHERWG
jgi:AraC-like DNA-binding protein